MNNRNIFSLASVVIVVLVALALRFCYFKNNDTNGYNATSWDALGYYMYQPGFIIYGEVKNLDWFAQIDSTYHVTGGALYQAKKLPNGNYVFKYLGGISFFQLPFFFIGHTIAKFRNVPQDGFSWPYQYSIMFGAIFWFFIGMLLLRKVLLHFFSDIITGLTILFIFLTTNLPQYISIDGAMSHSWIFPMYCIVIWLTHKWYEKPSIFTALFIGLICGIATISRPTECIMVFIPILWESSKGFTVSKWQFIRQNPKHLLFAIIGGCLGILPQLLYWKYTTGGFIYDVGSKWYFLTPWLRILFGFYSGWFVYTPITLAFIAAFWFMKNQPFKKAVITFCLLNIWIVTAWFDWKYGVSYAGRALSQGSPIYAFALAVFLDKFFSGKKRFLILIIGLLLTLVNFYQIYIYNSGTYHNFSVLEKIVRSISNAF